MTKIESVLIDYKKSVEGLAEALDQEKTAFMRDSAIKRFELCFDLSWKLLKSFLEEEKAVICRSPKDCFKEAYHHNIMSYKDEWIRMTDRRNVAVHTYNEELAEDIYKKLPDFLKLFQELLNKIENY